MKSLHSNDNARQERGDRLASLESAWYVGLVLMLAVDLVIRNTDGDLPLPAVVAAWLVAFFIPFAVVRCQRRRHDDGRIRR